MLTKRTNILFDQETWDYLVALARKRDTSVGVLVRDAVAKEYIDEKERIQKQREKAFVEIEKLRSQIKHKFSLKEIRESIEYGRKY